MNLATALRIAPGDVVALVGGGGKTTALFLLADEIVAGGGRVLTTTTTRIFAAQSRLAPIHIRSVEDLDSAFARYPHVLLTGPVDHEQGKAMGVSPDTLCNLCSPTANILVEADGSRMRPFKAPADHEPVIPACASLVVAVVGIDVLGRPLSAEFVHRPERVARIYPGPAVTPEMIAAVLAHSQGGRKHVPAGARFVPLINKVENEAQRAAAGRIAERLCQSPGVDSVLVGAAARPDNPVTQVYRRKG